MRFKIFTRVVLLVVVLSFFCSILGVFATWKFAEQPTSETKKEIDIGSVVFKYYDELVIKKITTVSSSVASEESKIDFIIHTSIVWILKEISLLFSLNLFS